MNKKEAVEIIRTISDIYGNKFKMDDPQGTVNAWFSILQDYDFDIIHANLMEYVKRNKFAPTVADLLITHTEERDRAVLNADETREMITSWEKHKKPDKEQADAALREMRKMLGIKRGENNG